MELIEVLENINENIKKADVNDYWERRVIYGALRGSFVNTINYLCEVEKKGGKITKNNISFFNEITSGMAWLVFDVKNASKLVNKHKDAVAVRIGMKEFWKISKVELDSDFNVKGKKNPYLISTWATPTINFEIKKDDGTTTELFYACAIEKPNDFCFDAITMMADFRRLVKEQNNEK